MPAQVVVGAQWGDEGKGKVVDALAAEADAVARYQGGNNAGHTVVVGSETHKFHLLPSGIIRPELVCVLGNGMVVDPLVLLDELATLDEAGVETAELVISDRAHVITEDHQRRDQAEEADRDEEIGTTGRGIGPTYEDKAARTGIRVADLVDPDRLEARLAEQDLGHLASDLIEAGREIAPYVADAGAVLHDLLEAGGDVLLEGAQGTMLDVDHGTYPFVTSSNPTAGAAATGTGIGPRHIDDVVAVAKAYTTRVGKGPFPTELTGDAGEHLREVGDEYGTTTGRPRRCGWLDLPVLRYAARVNGVDRWALPKLDVLGGLGELEVCTHYELDGEKLQVPPARSDVYEQVEPVYETLPGFESRDVAEWKEVADDGFDALPKAAQDYVGYVEEATGVPVGVIGVGPSRQATIVR